MEFGLRKNSRMTLAPRWPLLVLLLVISLSPYAEIYKWIDENGNTHFGDKPQNQDAEEIEISTKAAVDDDMEERRQKQQRLLEVFDEERQEKKARKAAQRQEKIKRKAKCNEAKKYLQEVKDAGFLYNDTEDPNNPEILSTAEREKTTAKAQARVERWCK